MVLFGGTEKGVSPDKFPKPPTTREMLEDIEALSQADPVLTFTHCLLRKGRGEIGPPSTIDSTDMVRDIFQPDESICDWLIDSLAVATVRDTYPKSNYTPKSPISLSGSSSRTSILSMATSPSTAPPMAESDVHTKLKQFSAICSKSEDLLGQVEERLRNGVRISEEIMDE